MPIPLKSSFIGVFFTFLIIYFVLRLIIKYFGPYIMRYLLQKLGKKATEKYSAPNTSYTSQKESGKTTIDYQPAQPKKSNKAVGEYIDYEEID